jgi:uncharacterized membrane protein
MNSELIIAVIAGLGGMLGWGLADFFAKKTIDEIGDIVTLVWGHIFGSVALSIIALYQFLFLKKNLVSNLDAKIIIILLFFGALQALVYLLVYKGFGKGQLMVLNPIFASFSGLVALFSVIFLKEVASGHLLVTLFGIFVGVLLLSLDFSTFKKGKFKLAQVPGSKEIFLATILAAVWTILWDNFVSGKNWITYALLMYVFMTMVLISYANFYKIKITFTKKSAWKFLVLIGITEIFAYLAISLGYSSTSKTSVVALISGAFSLPTIFLAHTFLKERISKNQWLGALIVIIGIILISIV